MWLWFCAPENLELTSSTDLRLGRILQWIICMAFHLCNIVWCWKFKMHSCVPLTKYMISLMSQMNLVDHMILDFVHFTHIICHEWPSCDKGGKGKKAEQVVNFVIFYPGQMPTHMQINRWIFFPQGRICTDCCIRMLRKLGIWGGDQVMPVFERKGCKNEETV